jgi:hypothetical protein
MFHVKQLYGGEVMRSAAAVKSFLMVFLSMLLFSCGSSRASIMAPDTGFESNVNYQPPQSEPDLESYQPESPGELSQSREQQETHVPRAEQSEPAMPTDQIDNRRMMTYSHSLDLVVENNKKIDMVKKTRMSLIEGIKNHDGFLISERNGSITARIPAKSMDAFLTFARTLGKVDDESRVGTDITDQHRDNISRLTNLRRVRDRYLGLLEQAHTVTDILKIEKELERITTQIEVLEGKIRFAEQSVAFSIVTVTFREKIILGPVSWVFYGVFWVVGALFVWD